ncbi:MAG: hypothetical protein EOS62_31465, partial [Mesorhizobium sp.]
SEQTYHHRKKAAAPSSEGSDLKGLVALEEENKKLKNLLPQRLRKAQSRRNRRAARRARPLHPHPRGGARRSRSRTL